MIYKKQNEKCSSRASTPNVIIVRAISLWLLFLTNLPVSLLPTLW